MGGWNRPPIERREGESRRALKKINIACDDDRLSSVEKIRRIKEEIEKAQNCLERLSLK
jgi:hypothetical protein